MLWGHIYPKIYICLTEVDKINTEFHTFRSQQNHNYVDILSFDFQTVYTLPTLLTELIKEYENNLKAFLSTDE